LRTATVRTAATGRLCFFQITTAGFFPADFSRGRQHDNALRFLPRPPVASSCKQKNAGTKHAFQQ
jgi:hypothetical protein